MALKSPSYLDLETLLSQAEYHDVPVPQQQEIVEKTVSKRSGGGKAGIAGFAVDGSTGTDIEYQSTYSLQPREKATVSKVIDSLTEHEAVKINPDAETALSKDDLVEVEGEARITAASLAGKMFFIFRRLMLAQDDGDLESIFNLNATDPRVAEQLKRVYLGNELLPIPILIEVTGSSLPQKVYVNVRPDFFIDDASASRVEGEMRVLGSVSKLVPQEQHFSAEQWLLHDWEFLMKRVLMTQMDSIVRDATDAMGIGLPSADVHAYISGPAIIVDAIALY
ncbi:hypothetical protein PV367_16885 [Streptomyces europaeiscabiei]|uniref:Uncharacterized protein n=1 Tax=Streptomyces europaeiscabiei TaxID=146819 RepID=A0AAJ2UM30_9ACTN|nr:hypothetical protein [Streptomyces europaeiscabiei]MDX3131414.1 hypothetical protein [Streptomyces europaeiscabiei]